MKIVFTFLLLMLSFFSEAQNSIITKYYDSTWQPSSQDKATFYIHLIKKEASYAYTAYWISSNKLSEIGTYVDTLFSKKIGLFISYYKNGRLQDSTYYNNLGKKSFHYAYYESGKIRDSSILDIDGNYYSSGYYENGQIFCRVTKDKNLKITKSEGYDSTGKIIPEFIYERDAEFKGGIEKWKKYLINHVNMADFSMYSKKHEDLIKQVIIKFIIDKQGNVSDVEVDVSSGIDDVDQDALRVIKESPKWNPAIQYNNPVNSYRRQPITYELSRK
jgi:TonB family protein